MRFKAAPEPEDHGDATVEHSEPPADSAVLTTVIDPDLSGSAVDEDEEAPLSQDFAPYDPTTLDDRHTDEWLQTAVTPEVLDKSLRRLDEQARSTIEEQGVNTLFLTLGMLYYMESNDSEQTYRAPSSYCPSNSSGGRRGLATRSARQTKTQSLILHWLNTSSVLALPFQISLTQMQCQKITSFSSSSRRGCARGIP